VHSVPTSQAALEDIELGRINQEVTERFWTQLAQLRAASALARPMRFAKTLGKSSWTEADLEALIGQPRIDSTRIQIRPDV
jgi:hypothetical protein